MKISQKEDFSLIFMGHLAKNPDHKFIPISHIAQKSNLSLLFLKHIARALLKNKLIESKEGIDGGYRLMKNPKDIKVSEILEALSVKGIMLPCSSKSCRAKKKNCACGTFWNKVNSKVMAYIETVTLSEFIKQ
jgi:Rrf2 family protein